MDVLERMSEELDERRQEMKSLQDFTKSLEGAKQDDLRIYWDVRVIRGADTPFCSLQGSSSLPGALSSKMKAHAPSMAQQEVMDKIAQPLTAVLMEESEVQNFIHEQPRLLEGKEDPGPFPDFSETGDGDSVERIAGEMSDVRAPSEEEGDDD